MVKGLTDATSKDVCVVPKTPDSKMVLLVRPTRPERERIIFFPCKEESLPSFTHASSPFPSETPGSFPIFNSLLITYLFFYFFNFNFQLLYLFIRSPLCNSRFRRIQFLFTLRKMGKVWIHTFLLLGIFSFLIEQAILEAENSKFKTAILRLKI